MLVCRLLGFYILATSKGILGWVLTCDSAYTGWLYSGFQLGDQAIRNMAWYRNQSHYLGTEPTSRCAILVMPSVWLGLGSDTCKLLSHWCDEFEPGCWNPMIYQNRRRSGHCLRLVCLLFYAIATLFQLYHNSDAVNEMRRRKPEPTLLLTKEIVNLPHHIGMYEWNWPLMML